MNIQNSVKNKIDLNIVISPNLSSEFYQKDCFVLMENLTQNITCIAKIVIHFNCGFAATTTMILTGQWSFFEI